MAWTGSATRLPVGDGALLGGGAWKMQPSHANMERRQCLSSFTLSSSRSPASAKPRGSAAAGGDGELELGEGVLEEAGAVALRGADEEDLGRGRPRRRVAGALGARGATAPGNLSATAVQSSGCTRYPR